MNNVKLNSLALWSKEEAAFMMADIKWKAQEMEARLKSPYSWIFFTKPEVQSHFQPIPKPRLVY
jgi:hypothetical protein